MPNPTRTSSVAGNIFTVVLWIYMLPAVFIFTPYYNWQYARENGFVRWLLLGEVVSTVKAFGWPYFTFIRKSSPAPSNTWTQEEKDNAKHLTAAFQADLEAIRIHNAFGLDSLPQDQLSKILTLEKTASMEASLVEDRILDKAHPQLKQHFRNELQRAIQLKIQVLEGSQPNASLNAEIDALEDKWVNWFNSSKDEIYIPK